MKTKARITSAEVAELAQVSQSAVSRTFTPGASVAPVTKAKVLDAASELGYRPNAIARTLISGRSRIIGLMIAYLDNQFYPIIIEQLSRELQKHGYQTLMFFSDSGEQDKQLEKILGYQVDGVVMASATLSSKLAKECADSGIPVVLFNRYIPGSAASSVVSDNFRGGELVAEHLCDAGHERIAYIAGDENSSTNKDREAGFVKGLHERGMQLYDRSIGGYSAKGATLATKQLMKAAIPPDAIFVANDHMAFAAMDTLRQELGMRIPEDVAIVGFDDVPQASWSAYSLTSVRQPGNAMIDACVSMLLAQIENASTESEAVTVPTELIVRGSSLLK